MKQQTTFYSKYGKRWFDLILAVPGVIAISPLLSVIALLVRTKLGSPVLFRQVRPGLHGKPFTLYKFRTMTNATDSNGKLLPAIQRMTRFGRFLRASSLDELPELWNVLKGEMSLVGPRPLRIEYLPLYTKEQNRRHDVKPGITGWAQIKGRNSISWEKKFEFDLWYVNNLCICVDFKILFKTFIKVLQKNDINQSKELTMEPFRGIKLNG